jgi:diacylglycerol kinase
MRSAPRSNHLDAEMTHRGTRCWLVLAIVGVWTAEALNTAFEFLTDLASPNFHPLAGKAKDVAAGAVLITAVGSVVIGALVLGPRVWELAVGVIGHRVGRM